MDDLTDEDLDAIEARCNAATPGPWNRPSDYGMGGEDDPGIIASTLRGSIGVARVSRGPAPVDHRVPVAADAMFIARARTDVPRLVAALRAERARVQAMVEAAMKGRVEMRADGESIVREVLRAAGLAEGDVDADDWPVCMDRRDIAAVIRAHKETP